MIWKKILKIMCNINRFRMPFIICMAAVVLPFCWLFPVATGTRKCALTHGGIVLNCTDRSLTQVPSYTFMQSIEILFLDDNKLSSLTESDFLPFRNVMYLNLARNKLQALADGIFDSLTKLQYLNLYSNQITDLPIGVFDTLTKLKQLSLARNQIKHLAVGIFDPLTELSVLILYDNLIADLTIGIFDSLTQLERLNLGSNQIKQLTLGLLDSVTELKILLLFDNLLADFTIGIFDSLTKLEEFTLASNQIKYLTVGTFDPLTELKFLTCVNDKIPILQVVKTSSVALFDNLIADLTIGTFDSLTRLEELFLSQNPLSRLQSEVFSFTRYFIKLGLPVLCNCTDNQQIALLFIRKSSFEVAIYNDTGDEITQEWIHLTSICNSSCLDLPVCTKLETCNTEETTDYMSTNFISTRWATSMDTTEITTNRSTHTAHIESPSMDTDGIIYTVVAATLGAIACAVVLYHASSRFQMSVNIVRTKTVTQADIECAVQDILSTDYDDGPKGRNGSLCRNIPPVSHQDMIWQM